MASSSTHHGEVVGGEAVALADDEVVEVLGGELHLAEHLVRDAQRLVGHAEADHVGLAIHACECSVAIPIRRAPVAEAALLRLRGPAQSIQLLLGLEGRIGPVVRDQPHDVLVVEGASLGLVEGPDAARVTADDPTAGSRRPLRPLVPVDAEPDQILEDAAHRLLGGARAIRVFDAQQEAAVPLRQRPIEQRGARAADVQVTRRRRRETRDDAIPHGAQA
jgi:hypothetical protein